MLGNGQLDQKGVDVGIVVERPDGRLELRLGDISGQFEVERLDADLGAVLVLHLHIAGARAVVSDEDRPEPRAYPVGPQVGYSLCQLGALLRRERLPVQQDGGHQWRKWRSPVSTIEIPRSSAAAMTSLSCSDPPGCTTAVTPAS